MCQHSKRMKTGLKMLANNTMFSRHGREQEMASSLYQRSEEIQTLGEQNVVNNINAANTKSIQIETCLQHTNTYEDMAEYTDIIISGNHNKSHNQKRCVR